MLRMVDAGIGELSDEAPVSLWCEDPACTAKPSVPVYPSRSLHADEDVVRSEEGKTAFCTGVNPGFAGGAYGYVAMGPYQGGQASISAPHKPPPIAPATLTRLLHRPNTSESPSPTSTH